MLTITVGFGSKTDGAALSFPVHWILIHPIKTTRELRRARYFASLPDEQRQAAFHSFISEGMESGLVESAEEQMDGKTTRRW